MSDQLLLPLQRLHDFNLEEIAYDKTIANILKNILSTKHTAINISSSYLQTSAYILSAINEFYASRCIKLLNLSFEDWHKFDIVIISDVEKYIGDYESELQLFTLYNVLHDANKTLIFSTSKAVSSMQFAINDLKSRLTVALEIILPVLSDKQLQTILAKRLNRLQAKYSSNVINYILSRFNRDPVYLLQVIDTLAETAFKNQRLITVPLIKSIFFI